MSLNAISPAMLKNFFPRPYYEKGTAYYHQNRVHHLEITPLKDQSIKISAQVRGSHFNRYHVSVDLRGASNNLYLEGTCSCPITLNCKHVVATLLQAINQPIPSIPSKNNFEINQFPPIKRDPHVEAWLQQMQKTLTQPQNVTPSVDETYRLCYLLNFSRSAPQELQLTLSLFRQLKSGNLGAPKKFNPHSITHEKHLHPIDHELLIKLEIAQKLSRDFYYGYGGASEVFLIKSEAGEKLLPELIATRRCYWSSVNNPALNLGESKKGEITWHLDENGFQQLRCHMPERKACHFFAIHQTWYLDQETWELGLLETGLGNPLAKLVFSAPKISPEHIQQVQDLLIQHEQLSPIVPPRIFKQKKIKDIKPIPCLRLYQAPMTVMSDDKYQARFCHMPQAVAALTFRYKNIEIKWEDERNIISQIEDEQLIQTVRHHAQEEKAINELLDHDVTFIHFVPLLALHNPTLKNLILIEDAGSDPLDFTLDVVPKLRASGWHIEMAEDYPYQAIETPIEDWYANIDESSGYDWFNLELGITVQGEKINLLPLLQQLLQKLQTTSSLDLTETKPFRVRLPDGRFILLPVERVQNILNVLIELYDKESLIDGQMLRLSKLQAARLVELEAAMDAAQLRWFGGENLRQRGAQLAQFKGIKTVAVPSQFHGHLRPYQSEGLNWLQFLREYEFGGILADEMGLGKTVQALSHLVVEKADKRMKLPSLIIAPTSLMFNWQQEAEHFAPNLKVLLLHGDARKQQFENMATYDLILTTYPLLIRDKEMLLKQAFYYLILDEAQCIKNAKSLTNNIVQQIQSTHRLCLTGTPLENHLGELWSLFHFLMPGLLGDEKMFNRLFRTPIEKQNNSERRVHLTKRIAPFLLRRTKENVVKELPKKVETIRYVELSDAQRDLYEMMRITMQKKVKQNIAKLGLARSHIIILDALLKLRQICCDPRLLKTTHTQKNHLKSAKLKLLMTLLPELIAEGRRILLFSQFTEMLALIETELTRHKIAYVKLTGQTKDRATPVNQFQNGEVPLFLISLKAGGTGLNLTAADVVIHYDPWWNPAVENQATDRAHRIGQDKTVFVYRLVTKGTVEEKMLEMQQHKRALMEGLFSAKTSSKFSLDEKDLQSLFEPLAM